MVAAMKTLTTTLDESRESLVRTGKYAEVLARLGLGMPDHPRHPMLIVMRDEHIVKVIYCLCCVTCVNSSLALLGSYVYVCRIYIYFNLIDACVVQAMALTGRADGSVIDVIGAAVNNDTTSSTNRTESVVGTVRLRTPEQTASKQSVVAFAFHCAAPGT